MVVVDVVVELHLFILFSLLLLLMMMMMLFSCFVHAADPRAYLFFGGRRRRVVQAPTIILGCQTGALLKQKQRSFLLLLFSRIGLVLIVAVVHSNAVVLVIAESFFVFFVNHSFIQKDTANSGFGVSDKKLVRKTSSEGEGEHDGNMHGLVRMKPHERNISRLCRSSWTIHAHAPFPSRGIWEIMLARSCENGKSKTNLHFATWR